MGLFDRFRGKQGGEPPREKGKAAARDAGPTIVVPEGHRVDIHRPELAPHVTRTSGGVVIADMGFGGDELPEVRGDVLRQVEEAVDKPSPEVCLSLHEGSTAGLFAPADPRVSRVPGVVLWIFHAASLGDWIDDPARLSELLRRIHHLGARRSPPLVQTAAVVDPTSAPGRLMIELLLGLGVPVRAPEKDGSCLVEVHRPEGIVISALTGRSFPSEGVDPYPRTVNQERDEAESRADRGREGQIGERERAFLAKRMVDVCGDRRKEALARAPRLGGLLLDVATNGTEASWQALNEELLRRDFPLVLMADPKTKAVAPRAWPGVGKALPAYPDLISLQWTAADLKMPQSSFALATMPPHTLLEWAAKLGIAVAINVYRDRSSPLYVVLPPERVEALVEARNTGKKPRGE